jgi:hypothetical protein
MIISKHEKAVLNEAEILFDLENAEGSFSHNGKN